MEKIESQPAAPEVSKPEEKKSPKTLAEARELLAAANDEARQFETRITAANTAADEARSERDAVKGQFDALTKEANKKDETIAGHVLTIGVKETEFAAQAEKLKTAGENVTRLETLCGLKG